MRATGAVHVSNSTICIGSQLAVNYRQTRVKSQLWHCPTCGFIAVHRVALNRRGGTTRGRMNRTIDPGRLARAIRLDVERLPSGRYRVSGGAEPHVVDTREGWCDCVDFSVRRLPCKHLLVYRLHEGDRETITGLREVVL